MYNINATRNMSWIVRVTKTDIAEKKPTVTDFPYDDLLHATADFSVECSIQSKYRATISGVTVVEFLSIESSPSKKQEERIDKSVIIQS